MATYLDKAGLVKVWEKVKVHDTATLTAAKNYTDELEVELTNGSVVVNSATNAVNALNDDKGQKISTTYLSANTLNNMLAGYVTTNTYNELLQGLDTGDIVVAEADKAYEDEDGNNIKSTYATKTSLSSYLKKTDTIDAEKINFDTSADWEYLSQVQGFADFVSQTDSGLANLNNNIKAINDSKGVANGICPLDYQGKVQTKYLPDSLLGQVTYRGLFNASTAKAKVAAEGTGEQEATGITIPTKSQYSTATWKPAVGDYFIVEAAGTFDSIELQVGDWLIWNGVTQGWGKVDNTDEVASVAGCKGAITAEQLREALGVSADQEFENGNVVVWSATNATKAAQDIDGNPIKTSYWKVNDLKAITDDEIDETCV